MSDTEVQWRVICDYTLSSLPPLGSMLGVEPVTMLVGLEDGPDGALKVYLGARWKRTYLLVTEPEAQEQFRRAWGGGGHIWMWPVPPPEELHKDSEADTPISQT